MKMSLKIYDINRYHINRPRSRHGRKYSKYKMMVTCIKDTLKAFDNLKKKAKKYMKYCFLICKSIYILKVCSIHYTLR